VKSPILQTKLIAPRIHPNLITRSRLSDQIEWGVKAGHKLTLVAAAAGFGKTTAVSSWVHQMQQRTAWLSLEESDDEPGVFWTYVLASIQTILPDFANSVFAALTGSPPVPVDSLLPALVNELTGLEHPLVLVLDDYHVIGSQEIHNSLSFLLDHLPPQFHLVIATRADPPLPVARLRGQRLLTEIRSKDLRFTSAETRALLNDMMKLDLISEEIELLEARTEGWGVGLLLAAQSMRGLTDKSAFIAAFSGSQHFILEYLMEEVLNRQTEDTRKFLLQTSILDRLCGPLCDAVTGSVNSEEILHRFSKDNLFMIPLDHEYTWYRYHHLFADLLVNFLQKEFSRAEFLHLHRSASRWYQGAGDLEKSIQYALSGQDYAHAADLIEQIVDQVIARGQVRTLLRWMGAIPKQVIVARPRRLMHQGWVIFLSGKVTQASEILQQAKLALENIPESEERTILSGRLSAMLGTITVLKRDIPTAEAQAQEALACLPEDDFIYRARARRVLGVCHLFLGELAQAIEALAQAKDLAMKGQNKFLAAEILSQMGTVRKHQGRLSLAFEAYQQITALYERPETASPACLGYIGMADIALERNDLQQAEAYLNQGISLCQQGHIGYALQPAYLIGGLLKCAQGDRIGALETIQKGEALSRMGGGSLESILGLAWSQTRFYLQCGELEKARGWAAGQSIPPGWSFEAMPIVLDEMHQSLLARVHLQAGELEKVLEIHERVRPQAEAGGRLARVIELDLFKAAALWKLGQQDQAMESIEKCLALAEPEGMVRLFLDAGDTAIDLLRKAKSKGKRMEYLARLEDAFSGPHTASKEKALPVPPQAALVEPLTEREMEVLRLMCNGYGNQDIADEMIVSVNTVKKHTSNIYGKLGVRNRAQAVLRASEMGLV
jgi:LuxR family maltose regulon positive regulatory protein